MELPEARLLLCAGCVDDADATFQKDRPEHNLGTS